MLRNVRPVNDLLLPLKTPSIQTRTSAMQDKLPHRHGAVRDVLPPLSKKAVTCGDKYVQRSRL
jgi:hypothetical protein